MDSDESTGASALADAPRGASDATFMASGTSSSAGLSSNERAMEGIEPGPLESGPGVETRPYEHGGGSAQPPTYASGPEFESGTQQSSARPEDRNVPPAGR